MHNHIHTRIIHTRTVYVYVGHTHINTHAHTYTLIYTKTYTDTHTLNYLHSVSIIDTYYTNSTFNFNARLYIYSIVVVVVVVLAAVVGAVVVLSDLPL